MVEKKYEIQIMLTNIDNLKREQEPVMTSLNFEDYNIKKDSLILMDNEQKYIPFQLIDIEERNGYLVTASIVYLVSLEKDELTKVYKLLVSSKEDDEKTIKEFEGIKLLEPTQKDGFRRLDTGQYILELCTGTADGTSYGKWGIRYFKAKAEDKNLIKDYSNAIGGFYGPFFTPKNGLINPPEHTTVKVTVEEEGPLYCRYRFDGVIPNGLDPNLRDKKFNIIWEFFYNTPWFRRQYNVDSYSTTVDGMPVKNKITVGDEYESGQGERVFTTFANYGGTYYRAGDLYAEILYDAVYDILNSIDNNSSKKLREYREVIGEDLNEVSWDYFWRLFCVEADLLDDNEIIDHVNHILPEAYKAVHLSDRNKDILFSKTPVDVNEAPNQTIFTIGADKTAHINERTGYSMVWYTSNPVARYQIVQRNDSGWVNWGTNGENEYPELPIGSVIYTAYGKFNDWENQADTMEKNIDSKQGMPQLITDGMER